MTNLEILLRKELDDRLRHLVGGRVEDVFEEYKTIVDTFNYEVRDTISSMTEHGYRMKSFEVKQEGLSDLVKTLESIQTSSDCDLVDKDGKTFASKLIDSFSKGNE